MLPNGWDIEVIEAHHNLKKMPLVERLKQLLKAIEEHGYQNVPAHALKVGDTFGEHTVWMCGPGERIELQEACGNKS